MQMRGRHRLHYPLTWVSESAVPHHLRGFGRWDWVGSHLCRRIYRLAKRKLERLG
jgi:hypothetical protein